MSRKIRSRENAAFRQLLRVTASARERRQLGVSFIEGIHLCQSYLARYGAPRQVVHTESALADQEVRELLQAVSHARTSRPEGATNDAPAGATALLGEPSMELGEGLFAELSQVEHGVGIAFVIDTPRSTLPAAFDTDCVYLDGLQDPGNVGTILRTCAAVGVPRVITAPGTAWCWSPKVLRAGMGAHFALEIHESIGWEALGPLLRVPALGTAAQASDTLWQKDLRGARLWVFGAEGRGVDRSNKAATMQWVSIPQRATIESLNVAAAAAVCLYEQLRQRNVAGPPAGA